MENFMQFLPEGMFVMTERRQDGVTAGHWPNLPQSPTQGNRGGHVTPQPGGAVNPGAATPVSHRVTAWPR